MLRLEVYTAKKQAEEERFLIILRSDDEQGESFKITKQMARTNQDVVGEKCIRNNHVDLAFVDCAKKAWKIYYSRLLNEEFESHKNGLLSDDQTLSIN